MKKLSHLLVGVVIGVLLATAGSAAAAQISMIGKKVTGEYTLKVNGKTLADKGSVIDGRANVPVRALSDALGASLAIEGRTIIVTNEAATVSQGESPTAQPGPVAGNKYMNGTKESLLELKANLENNILAPTIKGKQEIEAAIETKKKTFSDPYLVEEEKQLKLYEADITKYNEELRLINEALATK